MFLLLLKMFSHFGITTIQNYYLQLNNYYRKKN